MRLEDLTKEDCDGILSGLRSSYQYITLTKQYTKLLRKSQHQRAEETRLYILHLEEQYLMDFVEKYNANKITTQELAQQMKADDYEELLRNMHFLTMTVDMIDSRLRDMDDILKRYEGQFTFEGIALIKNVSKQCSNLLSAQRRTRAPKVEQLYADTMDSMEDYMFKRVDTLIKRLKVLDDQYKRRLEREEKKKKKAS